MLVNPAALTTEELVARHHPHGRRPHLGSNHRLSRALRRSFTGEL